MRLLPALAVLALSAPALADDGVTGTYDVKYDDAGSTCDPRPLTLGKGKLTIAIKKTTVSVSFDPAYQLTGTATKDGTINAKTAKLIGTQIGGLSARYTVVGHAGNGSVQLALTAQYIRQDTNKPYCAQTWNLTGTRAPAAK
jgi:hypothetical protein